MLTIFLNFFATFVSTGFLALACFATGMYMEIITAWVNEDKPKRANKGLLLLMLLLVLAAAVISAYIAIMYGIWWKP